MRRHIIRCTAIETGDIDPAKDRFTSQIRTAYNDGEQVVPDAIVNAERLR